MLIRPILIASGAPPSEAYVEPFQRALTGENGIAKFFASYAMPVEFEPIQRLVYTGPVDYRTLDNPWNAIYGFLQPITVPVVAVLVDWVEQSAYGWGGYPLAIVGQYAASRLLTTGTPEALVDDFHAMGLMAHEVSHCMGFAHDLIHPNNIMWTGLYRWPECVPSAAMADARRGIAAAPMRKLTIFLDSPCPRPG